jgi:hypothetical protein
MDWPPMSTIRLHKRPTPENGSGGGMCKGTFESLALNHTPVCITSHSWNDCDLTLEQWMRGVAAASELLKPFDARLMRSYAVSTRINSAVNDDRNAVHLWHSLRFKIISSRSEAVGLPRRCDNTQPNGLGTTNRFVRCYPANPRGTDPHNRMDECGSSGVPPLSVAGE